MLLEIIENIKLNEAMKSEDDIENINKAIKLRRDYFEKIIEFYRYVQEDPKNCKMVIKDEDAETAFLYQNNELVSFSYADGSLFFIFIFNKIFKVKLEKKAKTIIIDYNNIFKRALVFFLGIDKTLFFRFLKKLNVQFLISPFENYYFDIEKLNIKTPLEKLEHKVLIYSGGDVNFKAEIYIKDILEGGITGTIDIGGTSLNLKDFATFFDLCKDNMYFEVELAYNFDKKQISVHFNGFYYKDYNECKYKMDRDYKIQYLLRNRVGIQPVAFTNISNEKTTKNKINTFAKKIFKVDSDVIANRMYKAILQGLEPEEKETKPSIPTRPSVGDTIHTKGSNGEYYGKIVSIKKGFLGRNVCIEDDEGEKRCSEFMDFSDWEYEPEEGVWFVPSYSF